MSNETTQRIIRLNNPISRIIRTSSTAHDKLEVWLEGLTWIQDSVNMTTGFWAAIIWALGEAASHWCHSEDESSTDCTVTEAEQTSISWAEKSKMDAIQKQMCMKRTVWETQRRQNQQELNRIPLRLWLEMVLKRLHTRERKRIQ